GLQLMKEGAQYRFFIPAQLGYGQIGSGDAIEPNSTLIFDVELLEVLPKSSK
ncbi:MAG: FKBP-type peptidyl-prolyl cis-trans isomerase, partial [Acinetobacter sp.]